MPINSRQKGKRAELAWCYQFHGVGLTTARRSQQYCGADGAGDIIVPGSDIVFEVKERKSHTHHRYWEQAVKAARGRELALVLTHEHRGEWLAICRFHDLCEVSRRLLAVRQQIIREAGQ
jgi:hypothetical protein